MYDLTIIECTNELYPKMLLKIKNFPTKLYVMGNSELLNKNSIAIVGSRECTPYGAKYAKEFSKKIAKQNVCIVSGMAIGIDTYAHIGAFQEKGRTIAVLRSRI